MSGLYVALIHHPVYDRNRSVVTTALTNIDVHDIARSCCTFGARAFYVITPVDAHRALARRVVRHWQHGHGADYNPTRREALETRTARAEPRGRRNRHRTGDRRTAPADRDQRAGPPRGDGRSRAPRGNRKRAEIPYLVLLGTGWGLTETVLARADRNLAPIRGPGATTTSRSGPPRPSSLTGWQGSGKSPGFRRARDPP